MSVKIYDESAVAQYGGTYAPAEVSRVGRGFTLSSAISNEIFFTEDETIQLFYALGDILAEIKEEDENE